jgi:hypothetical protein
MKSATIKLVVIWAVALTAASIVSPWRADSFQDTIRRYAQARQPRIRYVYPPKPPLQPNGSYYTDEQLRQSNMTRYNASGKQQVQRHVEAWRSPLQRFDGDEQPGVFGTGYLGPLPNGPTDGPYCPPGHNCFRIDDRYNRGNPYYRRFSP